MAPSARVGACENVVGRGAFARAGRGPALCGPVRPCVTRVSSGVCSFVFSLGSAQNSEEPSVRAVLRVVRPMACHVNHGIVSWTSEPSPPNERGDIVTNRSSLRSLFNYSVQFQVLEIDLRGVASSFLKLDVKSRGVASSFLKVRNQAG